MKQKDEPGQSVGHHNGACQGCNEAKEGQGILMRQHEQEHEAEEPALGMTTMLELQALGYNQNPGQTGAPFVSGKQAANNRTGERYDAR